MYRPVLAFEDEYGDLERSKTFVSNPVIPWLVINEDLNELRALFNVALGTNTEAENFGLAEVDENFLQDLERGEYLHALIMSDEWEWMRTAPQDRPEWREQYTSSTDGRFVLLTRLD